MRDQLAAYFIDPHIPENVQAESIKNTETNNEKENSCSVNSRNDLKEHPSICDKNSASFALTSSNRRRRSLSSKSRVPTPLKKLGEGNIPGAAAADVLTKTESKTSRGKSFDKNATPSRRRGIHRNFHCDDDDDSPDKFENPRGGKKLVIYLCTLNPT